MTHENTFQGFFSRYEEQKKDRALQDMLFAVKTVTYEALKRPSVGLLSRINKPHEFVPSLSVRQLAAHAAADMSVPDSSGHLTLAAVEYSPTDPLFQIFKIPCKDCPDSQSIYISIALNTNHPKAHLWLHASPPREVLYPAIVAFADAAIVLAKELHENPGTVLYRNELPLKFIDDY